MKPETRNRKAMIAALVFGLFGIAFAVSVFVLTEDWFRRVHALLIGAINIGVALYLGRRIETKGPKSAAGADAREERRR